tara:strand:+ start:98 stop:664 length:567 start_codon:yes stop_codon:yes gene_type:complete
MTILYDDTANLSSMSEEELTELINLNKLCNRQRAGPWNLLSLENDYKEFYLPRSTNRVITARDSDYQNKLIGVLIIMSTKESRGVAASPPLAQWFVDNSVDIEKCCIPHVFVEQNYNVAAGLFETGEAKAVELGFEDWIMYGAFEASQEEFWKNLFAGRWSAMADTDGVLIDPIPGDALPHAVRVRLV